MSFTHLHTHSMYSLKDSIVKPEELVEKVKSCGHTSIAITDHGYVYGNVELYKICKKNNIKMIYGCELYITEDIENKSKESNTYHLIVLAKNDTGRININKLSSIGHIDGFYRKPRIDYNTLIGHKEGLIILSACMAGEVSRLIEAENKDAAISTIRKYKRDFGDDYYLEIQAHKDNVQKCINREIINLSKTTNVQTVVTTDIHYINKEDQSFHSQFIQMNQDRDAGETYSDCYYQSEEEIRENLSYLDENDINNAIKNTEAISNKCCAEVPLSAPIIPHVEIPSEYKDEYDYLLNLCRKGWIKRGCNKLSKEKQKIYADRVVYELESVKKMGFQGYYLLVIDYIKEAKRKSPGRGSSGGSIIAWLIGITEIDPIEYGLYFERFIDVGALYLLESGEIQPYELKIPDVDTDFGEEDRKNILEYLTKKYGEDRVVSIGTFQFYQAKSSIKDIGKVLGIPFEITNEITKNVDEQETLDEAIERNAFGKYAKDYPELFVLAQKVTGLPKSFSTHASGKIIAQDSIYKYHAIQTNKEGIAVIQCDMVCSEILGLVKIDLLGLRTIDVIYDVLDMIGKGTDYVSLKNLNFNDDKVWEVFRKGLTTGIFQFESGGMKQVLKQVGVASLEELAICNALYRPGAKDYITDYANRKHGLEKAEYIHPDLKPILQNSNGIIIFQEQLIDIGRLAKIRNPDDIRIATAKKKISVLEKVKPELNHNLLKKGWEQEVFNGLWEQIEKFAKYSFNRCLSGETRFKKAGQKNSVFNPTIEEMFMIKNSEEYAIQTGHIHLHKKYCRYGYGNALSMYDDNRIRKNKIVDIRVSGTRQTYKVITETGKEIVCTDNHKFPTKNGIKKLSKIIVGEELYVYGEYEISENKYNLTNGNFKTNYPAKGQCGFQKIEDGCSVIFEGTRKSHADNKDCCELCHNEYDGILRFELHHKDNDRTNNEPENFQWLCVSCHKKEHYKIKRTKAYEKGIPTSLEKIVSITPYKAERVFDIEMQAPAHNIVLDNGIVTSNSHAYLYSVVAFQTAFLKVYHPAEYTCATLNSFRKNIDKLKEELCLLQENNIHMEKIDYKNLYPLCTIKNDKFYYGTGLIKECNEMMAHEISKIKERKYNDFVDIITTIIDECTVSSKQIEILIKLGAFSDFGGNKKLFQIYEATTTGKTKYDKKHKEKTKVERKRLLREYAETLADEWLPLAEQLEFEDKYIGTITSRYDIDERYCFVKDVNTKYSPRIELYFFYSGKSQSVKVRKKKFAQLPIKKGDILFCAATKEEPALSYIDGEFLDIEGKFDCWMNVYRKVYDFDKLTK